LGQASEIALVGGEDGDACAGGGHGNKGIVCEAGLADLFASEFGAEALEELAGLRPVREIRNKDAAQTMKIALEPLHKAAMAIACSCIKFFEHNGAKPDRGTSRELPEENCGIVLGTQSEDVDRGVEKDWVHLVLESSVNILDADPGRSKPRMGQVREAVPFAFGNRKIQSAFDRFRFGVGAEDALGPADFSGVEAEVFV
jgi:hypothetical protein